MVGFDAQILTHHGRVIVQAGALGCGHALLGRRRSSKGVKDKPGTRPGLSVTRKCSTARAVKLRQARDYQR